VISLVPSFGWMSLACDGRLQSTSGVTIKTSVEPSLEGVRRQIESHSASIHRWTSSTAIVLGHGTLSDGEMTVALGKNTSI